MTGEMNEIKRAIRSMEYPRDKVGEATYHCLAESENFTAFMGRDIVSVVINCATQEEIDAANRMFAAITGYRLESVLEQIEQRDKGGYSWETLEEGEEVSL